MPTYTDREILKNREAGTAADYNMAADPATTVAQAHSYFLVIADKSADDAMASTTTAEAYTGIVIPYASRIKNIWYVATTGGITANDTTYATITISKRDSTGANPLAVATLTTTTTSSGNITQGAPKALVRTVANVDCTALSTLTYTIAKASTGVVVRAGKFVVELECI